MRKSTCFSVLTLAVLVTCNSAFAQEEPPPWFEPVPAEAVPPNITTQPDGSVSVTQTPEAGVDVHATTSAGTVHAYGCEQVNVDPKTATGSPNPCPLPHHPPGFVPPPPPHVYPPVKNPPTQAMKLRYAPDKGRRNALIASSIIFGLGTMFSGTAFVVSAAVSTSCDMWNSCRTEPSQPALYAMGAFASITPSIPRLYMGDYGKGLLFTALRGGSFAAGALVDWDDPTYLVPFTLAFVAPVTLGIIDLATTPRREHMQAREAQVAAGSFQLLGIGPTVSTDVRGNSIPAFGAMGTF